MWSGARVLVHVRGRELKVVLVGSSRNQGFPGGSVVKNPPAMQETQVPSLGQEDPLEEEMETHSSTLAWKIPWTGKPGGLQCMESQRVRTEQLTLHL